MKPKNQLMVCLLLKRVPSPLVICFEDTPDQRVADYGVFTALFNSGMILSCSNYDIKPPKVEVPPPEPVVPEVPPEEKVEDKKKEAAAAKNKKKGKTAEVEAPPVVSSSFSICLSLLQNNHLQTIPYSTGHRNHRRGSAHLLAYLFIFLLHSPIFISLFT